MKTVSEILKEIRPEFDFTTSADFIADGMLDSFDMVTLVASLDKTYGISIPGTDILPENFKNLQTIEALLRQSGVQPAKGAQSSSSART
jgi:acyl carrier protein